MPTRLLLLLGVILSDQAVAPARPRKRGTVEPDKLSSRTRT